MSVGTAQSRSGITAPSVEEPASFLFSREQYHQLGELGWFRGRKVELIAGEIVVQSPQNWLHASTTDRSAEVLRRDLGAGFWVRMQLPLDLGAASPSEPEPDVSVVRGSRGDYTDHPATALLLVEVSDTTLRYDRGPKASLYARAGIGDYWTINLVDRQLEVYRNPVPDQGQDFGFGYAAVAVLGAADFVTPLAAPQVRIAVADLLP